MKKISKLKVVTVILMIMLIVCSAKINFAAQITNIGNSTGNTSNNTPVNNVPTNNAVNNTPVVNNIPAPVNNTPLPATGSESSTGIIVLIALTSISAIYTYTKIRKYNI
mgnify:CR=1 FL=1